MNTLTLLVLLAVVVIFAVVFGSKARAPSLIEGLLFLGGFGAMILISVERWIGWANWIVNHIWMAKGMAKQKFNITDTINALKSGQINTTTAGTITITGLGALVALRFFTTILALLAGLIFGIIVKIWMINYGIDLEGVV